MEKFDIRKVISFYRLDIENLAKVLFPYIKYPKQALDRVLKGESDLSIKQIEKLADYIGILITDLYAIDTWKGLSENGYLVMVKGDYKVKLNYNGTFLSIYKNSGLISQEVFNSCSITMHEFIIYVDNIIKSYENGNN